MPYSKQPNQSLRHDFAVWVGEMTTLEWMSLWRGANARNVSYIRWSISLSSQLIILNYPSDCIDCEVWTAITYFWILSINVRFPAVNYIKYKKKKNTKECSAPKKFSKRAGDLEKCVNYFVFKWISPFAQAWSVWKFFIRLVNKWAI